MAATESRICHDVSLIRMSLRTSRAEDDHAGTRTPLTRRPLRARLVVVVGALALLPAGPAHASAVPPTLGAGGCYAPTQSNADFEAYGPTDVNAQAGNKPRDGQR